MDVVSLLISTVFLRPYVFILLCMHLVSGGLQIGPKKIVIFTVVAYLIAFASEFSSTRIGIPYGYYIYTGETHGKELYVANVPFMDSLSYAFLAYFSYSLALFVASPLYRSGLDVQIKRDDGIWHSKGVPFLATVFFVLQDVVVDPVALRGSQWFLGQIFYYPNGGLYFGVPLSNFWGWLIVGLAIIYSFQGLNGLINHWQGFQKEGSRYVPSKALLGPACYFLTMFFNLSVTFCIGEYVLGFVSLLIFAALTCAFYVRINSARVVDRKEMERVVAFGY